VEIQISEIEIGERHRKDLGDLEPLAQSIDEVGLLHPPTVNEDGVLIDGYRRIEACKMLGWKKIPVNRVNLENLVRGEHDANVFRKDFTPSEAVAIGKELEPELKKKAQERMKSGKPSSKLDEGRTDEKVGSIVGMGKDTYRKAKKVVDASEENPDNFREIKEQMDEGEISVDKAHRQVKRTKSKEEREKKAKEMPKPPALDRGELPLNEVICGDCIEVMNQLPKNSIHMVMFSPGYWGLRDYGMDGQIGMEDNYRNYIQKLVEVGRAIKRVLRPDGSWYLNLGDTYAGSWANAYRHNETSQREKHTESWDRKGHPTMPKPPTSQTDIKSKCKMLMPHRVALALIDDGWICRNDIIWHKPNPMPSSVKDRLNTTCEFVFHLVQQGDYWYDLDAIREPHKENSLRRIKHDWDGKRPEGSSWQGMDIKKMCHSRGKNPGDVIKEKGRKYKGRKEHSAGSRDWYWSEQRVHEPNQKEIARFLKPRVKGYEELLDEIFGEHKWRHWTRTDESGASLPSPDDWKLLKEVIEFGDEFDEEMLRTEMVPVTDEGHPRGKNPGDFWDITTKPFPEAHFATYPPDLCEKPIKSSCPPKVCARCGSPYERVTERVEGEVTEAMRRAGSDSEGDYRGIETKDYESAMAQKPSESKRRILQSMKQNIRTVGWRKTCGCETDETKPGIVLDPMAGSGTTGLVAKKLGRDFVLIDLNPDYVEMAKERIFE